MTFLNPAAPLLPLPRSFAAADGAQRLALHCAGLMLALMPPTVLALWLENRQLYGINLWIKPLHFELSLAVHFATLALLIPLIAPVQRQGRLLRTAMLAAASALVFEMSYMLVQAGRGHLSHFNLDTPLEAALYPLMGVGAVCLVLASGVTGLLIRKAPEAGVPEGLRAGAAGGLILGSVATLVVAGIMSSGTGHWVGGVASDASGLPLVGWSTTGGDLRVPHFFATHAMQALPLAGWLADKVAPRSARRVVQGAALVWAALIAVTFVQALQGRPFLPL